MVTTVLLRSNMESSARQQTWLYCKVASALFAAIVIDGLYSVIAKDALSNKNLKALIFTLYRDLGAFPILVAVAVVVDGPKLPCYRDVPLFFTLGLLIALTSVLYTLGLKFVTADVATILNLSQVPLTTIVAMLVGQERLSTRKAFGLFLGVGGSICLALPALITPQKNQINNGVWGYIVIPGACLCFSCYFVLQKRALQRYPPISVTAWGLGFAVILLGVISAIAYADQLVTVLSLSRQDWLAVAFAVIGNSVIKLPLNSFANAHAEATSVMAASCAVPITTAICAYLDPYERENPLKLKYLAFFPIVLGVFLLFPQKEQVERQVNSNSSVEDENDPREILAAT